MAVPVTVYSRDGCHLCVDAIESVERAVSRVDVEVSIDIVNVDEDPVLRSNYGDRVPCVAIDGDVLFEYRVDENSLAEHIESPSTAG